MKSRISALLLLAALAALAGCATPNGQDSNAANDPNGVYNDPTYPGRGVHIGVGAGSWGGRSGGGVGIGLGW